uniref:Putative secreted protein n=1 Tax=Ixodes ricinus TaxID=34613 RepID=A0A6B0U045_IXORI
MFGLRKSWFKIRVQTGFLIASCFEDVFGEGIFQKHLDIASCATVRINNDFHQMCFLRQLQTRHAAVSKI